MDGVIGKYVNDGERACLASLDGLIGELTERESKIATYAYGFGLSIANKAHRAIDKGLSHERAI